MKIETMKSSCLSSPPSNASSSPIPPRNTMGLYDPITKQRYPDIISAHLQLRTLHFEEWYFDKAIRESRDRQKLYDLLIDFNLQRELIKHGRAAVIVSFQVRTTGLFAVARLWKESKAGKAVAAVPNPHYTEEKVA